VEAYWASKNTALVMHTEEESEMGTTHHVISRGSKGKRICLLSLIRRIQRVGGGLYSLSMYEMSERKEGFLG
jgi:hypothetical protein